MIGRPAGLNGRIVLASVLLSLVVGSTFGLLIAGIDELRTSSREVDHSEAVIAAANRLQRLALDLETGQRGYVITGQPEFLDPLRRAVAAYPAQARSLAELVAAHPTQLRRARAIGRAIDSYRREWADRVIAVARHDRRAAQRLVATGRGRRRMDAIRVAFATFVGAEHRIGSRLRAQSNDEGRRARWIGISAIAGSALLILVYASYLFRLVTVPVRRVAEGARRLAAGDLSARVPERGVGEISQLAHDFNAMASSLSGQREQLARQNTELQAVLDATLDSILMTDAEGNVLFTNRKMDRFWAELGFPDEGTIWDRMLKLAQRSTTPDAYHGHFARIASNPAEIVEAEFTLADSGRTFIGHTAPVTRGRDVVGRIFSTREVTAERQSERAKDEFVATVSHELRTPLTSIFGYAELLLDPTFAGALDDQQRTYVEVVRRNAHRLQRLVADLLFFSQVQSDRLALEVERVDITSLAAAALDAARPAASERRIGLKLEADTALELEGDASRLEQLLDNLVSNAVKFTPDGGDVCIRVHRDGDMAILDVSDTGIGIPEDELDRLFTRFFRASTATDREIRGTGLGLAIARTIAEGHGGAIHVSSQAGRGTTFTVRLPVHHRRRPQPAAAALTRQG